MCVLAPTASIAACNIKTKKRNTKELANKTFLEIAALRCDAQPPNLSTVMDQLDPLVQALADAFEADPVNPWNTISTTEIRKLPPQQQCERLKETTANPNLLAFIDNRLREFETQRDETNRLLDALQKRQAALAQQAKVAEAKEDRNNGLLLGK